MTTRRTFLSHLAATAAACVFASSKVGAQPTASPEKMLTRKIPSTGEAIPVVGLGTYQGLMTRDMTEQTLAPLAEVLKRFFDAGGRLVDTAPSYGNAEEVAGRRRLTTPTPHTRSFA